MLSKISKCLVQFRGVCNRSISTMFIDYLDQMFKDYVSLTIAINLEWGSNLGPIWRKLNSNEQSLFSQIFNMKRIHCGFSCLKILKLKEDSLLGCIGRLRKIRTFRPLPHKIYGFIWFFLLLLLLLLLFIHIL